MHMIHQKIRVSNVELGISGQYNCEEHLPNSAEPFVPTVSHSGEAFVVEVRWRFFAGFTAVVGCALGFVLVGGGRFVFGRLVD